METRTLVQRREALGLNQSQLARAVGVDRVTVWRWETNVSSPTPLAQRALDDTLARLEAAVTREAEAS